ncbi:ribonuclease H-like domain-containing protein [Tanacetum coccineum]
MMIKEFLNVRFNECPTPKSSPLVDDDIIDCQIIENQIEDIEDKENRPLNKEIVNIKEAKNHPLETVIGNLNERTLRSQRKYATEILERSGMASCNSSRTLIDTESKLGDDGDPIFDSTLYRSLAGSLQYLTFTRPDISYVLQQVCLYIHDPREPYFLALKRVLSVEAEYRGVANAVVETCRLRNLFRELHTPLSSTTLVYCDNVSVVYLSCNPVQHQCTKHIEIDIHFSRDLVLLRSLYGLKQVPRLCYMHQPPGFVDSRFPNHGSQVTYLLIYVDDIILTASSPALLQQIIDSLHNEFHMTDLRALNYFLGISADCNSTGLFLSQKKYALQLLERAHMVHCNPSRTPVDTESKLGPDGVHVRDPTLYRSLARGLQCLTFTRPDLSYVVQQLYAFATTSLVGYTDADWAGFPSTRSAETEYRGVANVVAKTAWLRNLLRELHSPLSTATLVYCDNVNAVYMSANPVQHQWTKHIEIDIHFVRDMVTAGQVRVPGVPSCYQYADIFTKGLPSALFKEFRSILSVHPPPAPTAGVY